MEIEKKNGIHSKEKHQVDYNLSAKKQYDTFNKLDYSKCSGDKPIEIKPNSIDLKHKKAL